MFPLIDKRATGINLRRIMDEQNISARDVQEYLGLGCVQSVYRWLDGVSMPTVDNLYAMSQLFHIPIDEMVCGNRAPIVPVAAVATPKQVNARVDRLITYCQGICGIHAA